jgi:hypothetical protein
VSNPFKAIGKAFKAVVKVVKKVALPALAIGAVVLTGGAALGVLPALGGAGGLLAGIGITGPLAGVLTSAATSATIGAVGSALTGGSIIKGATTGLIVGGAMGGLGALMNPAASASNAVSAAGNATKTGATAANAAGNVATTALPSATSQASAFTKAFTPFAGNGAVPALGGVPTVAAVPTSVAAVPAAASVPSSGGFLSSVLGNDPMVRAMAVQGLGNGISAASASRDQQRAREQIIDNYSGEAVAGLPRMGAGLGAALPDAGEFYNSRVYGQSRLRYDPQTGEVRMVG